MSILTNKYLYWQEISGYSPSAICFCFSLSTQSSFTNSQLSLTNDCWPWHNLLSRPNLTVTISGDGQPLMASWHLWPDSLQCMTVGLTLSVARYNKWCLLTGIKCHGANNSLTSRFVAQYTRLAVLASGLVSGRHCPPSHHHAPPSPKTNYCIHVSIAGCKSK